MSDVIQTRPYLADFVAGPLSVKEALSLEDMRVATHVAIQAEGNKHLVKPSQAHFARQLGIAKTSLSDFMCGRRRPPPELVKHFGLEEAPSYRRPRKRMEAGG